MEVDPTLTQLLGDRLSQLRLAAVSAPASNPTQLILALFDSFHHK